MATQAQLEEALREELVSLWADASHFIRVGWYYADPSGERHNSWSMGFVNIAERITTISKLIGPCSWRDIQLDLIDSGLFQRITRDAGFEPEIDQAELAAFRVRTRSLF